MTITPAATSVLADMMGGGSGTDRDIAMMIGIGLNKESDAVFFQYLGEEKQPAALTIPSNGKPLTYLRNVRLVGIEIAEDIGTFKSTKINVFLESGAGNVVMLTSGLTTLWSQFLVCGLLVCIRPMTSTLHSLSTAGRVQRSQTLLRFCADGQRAHR